MPTIEISEDQYEALERLQKELGEDVTYGHVRHRDVVQYLLDTHDEAAPAAREQASGDATTPSETATTGDGLAGAGDGGGSTTVADAAAELSGSSTTTTVSGTDAGSGEDTATESGEAGSGEDTAANSDEGGSNDDGGSENADTDDGAAEAGEEGNRTDPSGDDHDEDDTGEAAAGGGSIPTPGGGGDRLSKMMNLLEEHDDKWEQEESGDGRYVVELPDGSTEAVQTRDDVKALLFKNY